MSSTLTGDATHNSETSNDNMIKVSLLITLPSFAEGVCVASIGEDYDNAIKDLTVAHDTVGMLVLMHHYKDPEESKSVINPVTTYACSQLDPKLEPFSTDFRVDRDLYPKLLKVVEEVCEHILARTGTWFSSNYTHAKNSTWQELWSNHLKESNLTKSGIHHMLKKVKEGLNIPNEMDEETVKKLFEEGQRLNEAFTAKVRTFSETSEPERDHRDGEGQPAESS